MDLLRWKKTTAVTRHQLMPRQKYIPAKFFGAGFMDKPVRNPKAHINIYI